jgi:hypothetical protein
MKNFVVAVAILMLFTIQAFGQLVPLELTNTIPLPSWSTIWDVMPHPDGYYLWVQAAEPAAEQTRIYFGRSDSSRVDSIDLAVGSPQAITCFWRGDYEACVVLASRYSFMAYPSTIVLDSTFFRTYRLLDGRPDSAFWLWPGSGYRHIFGYSNWDLHNYRMSALALDPAPPAVSVRAQALISHFDDWWGTAHGYSGASYATPGACIANMLDGNSSRVVNLPGSASYATWTIRDSAPVIAYSGGESGWSSDMYGHHGEYSQSDIHLARTKGDSLSVSGALSSCSETAGACPVGMVAAVGDSTTGQVLCFTRLSENDWGVVASPSLGLPLWTTARSYEFWLSAECVSSNSTEEFLCYDSGRQGFDVYEAATGRLCAVTDPALAIGPGARIIGRFDQSSRRLAILDFQAGSAIQLWHIGETASPPPVPPLVVSDFAGSWLSNGIRLSFTVHFEHGVRDYELWRSHNADGPFSRILTVPAALGEDSVKTYTCTDSTATDASIRTDGAYYLLAVQDSADTRTEHREKLLHFGPTSAVSIAGLTGAWGCGGIEVTFNAISAHGIRNYEMWRSTGSSSVFARITVIAARAGSDSIKVYSLLDSTSSLLRNLAATYYIATEDSVGFRAEHRDVMFSIGPPQPIVHTAVSDFSAAWSAAGLNIRFAAHRENQVCRYEIWRSHPRTNDYVQGALIFPEPGMDSVKSYTTIDTVGIDSLWRSHIFYCFPVVLDSLGGRVELRTLTVRVDPIPPPIAVNSYALSSYPNPFNPSAIIVFSVVESQRVQISLYDVTGQSIQTIVDATFTAGEHRIRFDGKGLSSGIYFARMQAGSFEKTAKMLLIR